MIVIILLLTILGAILLYCQKLLNKNEPPVLPGGLPIIGHAYFLLGDCFHFWNRVREIANISYALGGVVSISVGPKTIYAITDPDDAFTVANTCLEKDKTYDFAKPWLGDGLVTAPHAIWKNHRKLLQPAFNSVVLDGYLEVFNRQSRKMVKALKQEVGKGLFDQNQYTKAIGLETICSTAFDIDLSDDTDLNKQFGKAVENIFDVMLNRFRKPWLYPSIIFNFSSLKKKQDACLKIIDNMTITVLNKRRSALKKSYKKGNDNEKHSENNTKFKPFMDLLIELTLETGAFNDEEIKSHVNTMIAAGYETTALVLTFTLMLLGSHPEVQEKLNKELQEVFGESDRDVEKADLPKLVYLEAVLKESMRFHSIGPVNARMLDRDVKLKNCTLSAGTTCAIIVFGINRHPMWGEDANQFNPERWLDPSRLPESPNANAAFMLGRRACIGKGYAFMALKTTLSHVLRRYKVHSDDSNLVLKIDGMLRPSSGYFISIEDRKIL